MWNLTTLLNLKNCEGVGNQKLKLSLFMHIPVMLQSSHSVVVVDESSEMKGAAGYGILVSTLSPNQTIWAIFVLGLNTNHSVEI